MQISSLIAESTVINIFPKQENIDLFYIYFSLLSGFFFTLVTAIFLLLRIRLLYRISVYLNIFHMFNC